MSMSYTAFASSEQTIKIIEFDIPQQNADISLTEFAQQANITLIFPYDIASEFEANPLEGEHSIQEAIGLLLEGTPLKVLVGENGQLTIATDSSLGDKKSMYKKNQLSAAVAGVISTLIAGQAVAQDNVAEEEVLVTGIRGSLQRAMDVKRDTGGVVDAISAEDMGKFPDTNLAESLQRITGVSINRVNGEGSEVTVRGFGAEFNLVTLNGRQMPAANVGSITGNPLDQGVGGTTRSFDFSNLASEGVSGLQVYKTGRADSPTGGIGATINIQTIKPLDGGGTRASFGGKLVDDQSGDDITPEVSGLFSWANDSDTFGVAVFGSYQERDSGSQHSSVEQYQLQEWNRDTSPATIGMTTDIITNNPANGNVVGVPTNIGLGLNEDKRERVNTQVTLQYSPSDALTFTADALYAQNEMSSVAIIDGVWFARTFTDVVFDGDPVSASPASWTEDIDGGKDFFFQNLTLATKDELNSFGFNVDWQASDNLNLRFDVASSEAESSPNGPYGRNVTRFNVAGANAGWQTADFTGEFPQASIVIDDSVKGNNNGIFDIADLGTQVARTTTSSQKSSIDQISVDGTLEVSDDMTVNFGLGSLTTEMQQNLTQTQDALGDWGVNNPGEFLGREDLIDVSCTGCAFDADISGVAGADAIAQPPGSATVALGSVSFRGDSVELLEAFAAEYGYGPETENLTAIDVQDNFVEEELTSAYVQLNWDLEIGGLPANILTGLRYENTDVTSTSSQAIPDDLSWVSDNDFVLAIGNNVVDLSDDYSYSNFLPSIDFSVDLTDDVKARASLSKTIARPQYSDLFTATTVGVPDRPILNGGQGSASSGNVALDPLESTNFDLSVEWYYDESSFLSVGYYSKDVSNFVGVGQVTQPLFDLRDPTSGQAGTRSGAAAAALADLGLTNNGIPDERDFFTMTAVLDNPAAFPNGAADFEPGQEFADAVFAEYSVSGNADDPFYQFERAQPVNDQDASIDGFEINSQHFFGDSGFGYQANYTTVNGDIAFDNGSSPAEDQFALPGLSDSANFVLIYENYGWSARVAYNWRDAFLDEVNRAASGQRNPLYVDEFTQIDFNVSYEFSDNLTVSLDGININEEGTTQFGRSENQRFFVQELAARYVLGVRYTF